MSVLKRATVGVLQLYVQKSYIVLRFRIFLNNVEVERRV